MKPISVVVTGDTRQFQAAMRQTEQSLGRLEGSVDRASRSTTTALRAMAAVGGAYALAQGFMAVVNAASRLEQSQGAVTAVFKDQSGVMQAAAASAHDAGLSTAAYGEMAVRLGSQLKNLGVAQQNLAPQTQGLIDLGADLAAQFGGTTQDAVEALSATFRGEYDPIEKYGVTVRATAVQAKMAAEGISQAQATVALITEQSADALGAAEREYDTFASAQQRFNASFENAQAALGQAFLPIVAKLADALASLAQLFVSIPSGVRDFAVSLTAAIIAMKALNVALAMGATRMRGLSVQMAASQGAFTSTIGAAGVGGLATKLQRLAGVLPGVGLALFALAEVVTYFNQKAKEGAIAQEEFTQSLTTQGELQRATIDQLISQFQRYKAESDKTWRDPISMAFNHDEIAEYQQSIDNLNEALMSLMRTDPAAGAAATRDAYRVLQEQFGMTADEARQHLAGSLAEADRITFDMGEEAVSSAQKMGVLIAAFEETSKAASDFMRAMEAIFAFQDVDVALEQWREKLAEIATLTKGGLGAEELQGITQQWWTVLEAMKANGAGADQLKARYDQMFAAVKAQLQAEGYQGKELAALLDYIFKPRKVKNILEADAGPTKEAAKFANQHLNGVAQVRPAPIDGNPTQAINAAGLASRAINSIRQAAKPIIDATAGPALTAVQTIWNGLQSLVSQAWNIFVNVIPQGATNLLGMLGITFAAPAPVVPESPEVRAYAQSQARAASARAGLFDGLDLLTGRAFTTDPITVRVPVTFDAFLSEWSVDYAEIDARIAETAKLIEDKTREIQDRENRLKDANDSKDEQRFNERAQRLKDYHKEQLRLARQLGYSVSDLLDPKKVAQLHLTSKATQDTLNQLYRVKDKIARADAKQVQLGRKISRQDRIDRRRLKEDQADLSLLEQQRSERERYKDTLEREFRVRQQILKNLQETKAAIDATAAKIMTIDLGDAYSKATASIEGWKSQIEDAEKNLAEAWNPTAIAYWTKKKDEALAELGKGTGQALKDELRKQMDLQLLWSQQLKALKGVLPDGALQQLLGMGPGTGSEVAKLLLNDAALREQFAAAFNQGELISQNTAAALYDTTYEQISRAINDAYADYDLATGGASRQATWNVTVQGNLVDPEGATRAIERLLNDRGARLKARR